MEDNLKSNKLLSKTRISGEILLLTGLHIGAGKENVEIGGIDLPVVRQKLGEREPYIPGSSLKGKIRCLLEQTSGAIKVGDNRVINQLFGITEIKKEGKIVRDHQRTRLIVRDARLSKESIRKLEENNEFLDMPFTEAKWENTIKRLEGTAENPRQIERVPAGSVFKFEIVMNNYDDEVDFNNNLKLLRKGLSLLEKDYLGGNGSRGYGAVEFQNLKISQIDLSNGSITESESKEWTLKLQTTV
jgi:CRISPR-associated protein Csm3